MTVRSSKRLGWLALAALSVLLLVRVRASSSDLVMNDSAKAEDARYLLQNVRRQRSIPRIVHLVFGLADDFAGKPWTVINYLAVLSAKKYVRGARIKLYYRHLPEGEWWEKTRRMVELVHVRDVPLVFGKKVHYTEHKGDVIRLEALMKYGGVYIDSDTLILRDLSPLMEKVNTSAILGLQQMDSFFADQLGLCNAMILAVPDSIFLRRWYDGYQTLNVLWDQHSVRLPKSLADIYPLEVRTLPVDAFFWPSHWDVKHIWELNVYDFSDNYAMHLWSSGARRTVPTAYTKYKDLQSFCATCSTLSRMARQILGDKLQCSQPCNITIDSANPPPVVGQPTTSS